MPRSAIVRLFLFLLTLAGLLGLAFQNLSPQITLVFLGMTVARLPLGLLILAGIAAGVGTGLILHLLLRMARYFTWRQFQSLEASSSFPGPRTTDPKKPTANPGNPNSDNSSQFQQDWQLGWQFEEFDPQPPVQPEDPQGVYDADYRVIRPPHQETYRANTTTTHDTSVFDFDPDELDFDFDIEDPTPNPPRKRRAR